MRAKGERLAVVIQGGDLTSILFLTYFIAPALALYGCDCVSGVGDDPETTRRAERGIKRIIGTFETEIFFRVFRRYARSRKVAKSPSLLGDPLRDSYHKICVLISGSH